MRIKLLNILTFGIKIKRRLYRIFLEYTIARVSGINTVAAPIPYIMNDNNTSEKLGQEIDCKTRRRNIGKLHVNEANPYPKPYRKNP